MTQNIRIDEKYQRAVIIELSTGERHFWVIPAYIDCLQKESWHVVEDYCRKHGFLPKDGYYGLIYRAVNADGVRLSVLGSGTVYLNQNQGTISFWSPGNAYGKPPREDVEEALRLFQQENGLSLQVYISED